MPYFMPYFPVSGQRLVSATSRGWYLSSSRCMEGGRIFKPMTEAQWEAAKIVHDRTPR